MNNGKLVELKENTWGILKDDYDNLDTNEYGIKLARGMPDGTQLEVFNLRTGKIEIYAEAFKEVWYER